MEALGVFIYHFFKAFFSCLGIIASYVLLNKVWTSGQLGLTQAELIIIFITVGVGVGCAYIATVKYLHNKALDLLDS